MAMEMERWKGCIALVTGAYCGIGAAFSESLIKEGIHVVGCGRNLERLTEYAERMTKLYPEGPTFTPVQCDVSKEEEVLLMFKTIKELHGTLHICINNAGFSKGASLLRGKTEQWREMMDVNILGLSIVTREAVKLMRESDIKEGHVCNICSTFGHAVPPHSSSHFYSATKFAVNALTEGLRQELREAKLNIRVMQLSPSVTETEFFVRQSGAKTAKKILSSVTPLQPQDVADAFMYALAAPAHVQVHDVIVRPTDG